MDISNQIYDILKSENFKRRLERINENYPNLKQESFIRNAILEIYNENCTDDFRAFAEHPRDNGRTDLSIVKKSESSKPHPYKIEVKFFFSKDVINGRLRSIEKEFVKKVCNLYILIVQEFEDIDKKKEFDKQWDITSNLLRYHNANSEEGNFGKLDIDLNSQNGKCADRIIHTVNNPYQVKYTFFFLEGN